jgi:tRNA threonylcarbamoyladenosine biosynthesis protein TsaB
VRVLAVDTATEACSAAVLTPRGLASRYEELERAHAERILGMVDAVLAEAGVSLGELDAVAFGCGPGAFTGCRLAASIAQGLAFGAGRRVVPVSDLRALAQRVLDASPAARGVLVCTDARMQEVYWGCFKRDASGLAEPCGIEHVSSPAAVELPRELEGQITGVGRGFLAHPLLREKLQGRLAAIEAEWLPRAGEVARLAVPEVAAGRLVLPQEASPVYLRDEVTRAPRRN